MFTRLILLLMALNATNVAATDDASCVTLPDPDFVVGRYKFHTQCVAFTVSPGTGCAWMCNYCQEQLGTTNYYFTDGVCHYETGGCVGDPLANHQYTCCIS